MTAAEIITLAGRELDVAVAVDVLDWKWWASRDWSRIGEEGKVWQPWRRLLRPPSYRPQDDHTGDWSEGLRASDGTEQPYRDFAARVPCYSTDPAAAWRVLLHVRSLDLGRQSRFFDGVALQAELSPLMPVALGWWLLFVAEWPVVVCRAALLMNCFCNAIES